VHFIKSFLSPAYQHNSVSLAQLQVLPIKSSLSLLLSFCRLYQLIAFFYYFVIFFHLFLFSLSSHFRLLRPHQLSSYLLPPRVLPMARSIRLVLRHVVALKVCFKFVSLLLVAHFSNMTRLDGNRVVRRSIIDWRRHISEPDFIPPELKS